MRLYDRYLIVLALLFTGTTALLAVYGRPQLDLYFSLYLIEYVAATLLMVQLNAQARRVLHGMGYILLAGFLAVVALRAAAILSGIGLLG